MTSSSRGFQRLSDTDETTSREASAPLLTSQVADDDLFVELAALGRGRSLTKSSSDVELQRWRSTSPRSRDFTAPRIGGTQEYSWRKSREAASIFACKRGSRIGTKDPGERFAHDAARTRRPRSFIGVWRLLAIVLMLLYVAYTNILNH